MIDIFCTVQSWFLYQLVTHFTIRTYGANRAIRFVEGIWLHRKSRQIRFFRKRPILHHTNSKLILDSTKS